MAEGRVALIRVKTQFENLGDALITRELVRLISQRAPVIVDATLCPPAFQEAITLRETAHRVEYVRGRSTFLKRVAGELLRGRRLTYFFLPGGLGGELPRGRFLKAVAGVLALSALRSMRVEFVHAGVSYDRLGRRFRMLVRARTLVLRSHAVRDDLSAAAARSLGIRVDRVIPDLSFAAFQTQPSDVGGRRTVALSFRTDKLDDAGRDRLLAVVASIVAREQSRDASFVIVSQVERDHPASVALADHLRRKLGASASVSDVMTDIDACAEVYRRCDVIYSNRLHALLLAASVGCVPVAVIDERVDAKIKGVFNSVGLADNLWPIELEKQPSAWRRLSDDIVREQQRALHSYFDEVLR